MAVKNILPEDEIDLIVEIATERGGLVSYKTGKDGQEEPYEINITWFSALNQVESDEDPVLQVKRFVASRLIALVLKGVPGIYLHSLASTSIVSLEPKTISSPSVPLGQTARSTEPCLTTRPSKRP